MYRVGNYEKIVRAGVGPMKKRGIDDRWVCIEVKGKFMQRDEEGCKFKFKTERKETKGEKKG